MVLIIVSMASSLVGPKMWNAYVRVKERSVVEAFGNALLHKRLDSLHGGNSIALTQVDAYTEDASSSWPPLPSDWQLLQASPLRFLPNGVTNGGNVMFESPAGHRWQLTLTPLQGRVTIKQL